MYDVPIMIRELARFPEGVLDERLCRRYAHWDDTGICKQGMVRRLVLTAGDQSIWLRGIRRNLPSDDDGRYLRLEVSRRPDELDAFLRFLFHESWPLSLQYYHEHDVVSVAGSSGAWAILAAPLDEVSVLAVDPVIFPSLDDFPSLIPVRADTIPAIRDGGPGVRQWEGYWERFLEVFRTRG